MNSNQLVLFKGVDVKKLDTCLFELHNMIYDMKWVALLIEVNMGRNRAFNLMLENARLIADLTAGLSDLSFKYLDWTPEKWKKATVYEPYYAALEPRSTYRLAEIASEYKSGCNAILLRLKACLTKGSIAIPENIDQITINLEKAKQYLKLESTKL